jgi:hypothetical protein
MHFTTGHHNIITNNSNTISVININSSNSKVHFTETTEDTGRKILGRFNGTRFILNTLELLT